MSPDFRRHESDIGTTERCQKCDKPCSGYTRDDETDAAICENDCRDFIVIERLGGKFVPTCYGAIRVCEKPNWEEYGNCTHFTREIAERLVRDDMITDVYDLLVYHAVDQKDAPYYLAVKNFSGQTQGTRAGQCWGYLVGAGVVEHVRYARNKPTVSIPTC